MGESLPQLTRALASDIADLHHIDEVVKYDDTDGSVTFNMKRGVCMADSRINKLLPDGWTASLVITDGPFTAAYIEEE